MAERKGRTPPASLAGIPLLRAPARKENRKKHASLGLTRSYNVRKHLA